MFNENEFRVSLDRARLTVKQVAEFLGISTTTLYRKMSGESDFYREEIQKICYLIGEDNRNKIFFDEKVT